MFNSNFFKIYILPGMTFQSIVISGGYCTGQEMNQYFLALGPTNGLYGLIVTTVMWSIVCAASFVFAILHRAYDYKKFFKSLLGRAWVIFEIAYLYLVLIVLSVIAASVGSLLQDLLGIPYIIGLILPFIYILFMVYKSSESIEKMFSFLSIGLYAVFIAFLYCCYQKSNNLLFEGVTLPSGIAWVKNGIAYASYNVGALPAVLFTLRHLKTRRQALISGLLAGPLASMPGVMLLLALSTQYPSVLDATVPSVYLLNHVGVSLLTIAFSVVLISTLVETGVGVVYAFKDRIHLKKYKKMPVIILLIVAFCLGQLGLVNLIAEGYRLLTWFMIAVFIVPLLTVGITKTIYFKNNVS
ncbi:MAG: hypothetical protein U1E78_01430 [Gammaproteobacteria bacterium]